jgi:hypothetical protein
MKGIMMSGKAVEIINSYITELKLKNISAVEVYNYVLEIGWYKNSLILFENSSKSYLASIYFICRRKKIKINKNQICKSCKITLYEFNKYLKQLDNFNKKLNEEEK